MDKRNAGKSWTHSGTVFVALLAILGLVTSCSGGSIPVGTSTSTSGGSPIPPPPPLHCTSQPSIGSICSAVTAAASTPYLNTGANVQYFCDCTGAGQSCVAAGATQGSDSSGNGTQISPYQTIGKAMAFVNGSNNRTAALCQGGSFPTAGSLTFSNTTCTAGTICNEIREYPLNGTNAKPIIDGSAISSAYLLGTLQQQTNGGWRIMNLTLQGPNTTGPVGIYIYTWLSGALIHDILIENDDIYGFSSGIGEDSIDNNITITGNHFYNNLHWGYIGAANNLNINYNSFINNGSDTTYDHSIYVATNKTNFVSNVNVIGNYMTGYSSLGTKCVGEQLVAHAAITNFVVSNNVIVEPANSALQCYGMSFDNSGGATNYAWYRNAVFSNNIIVNVGNIGMQVSNCPSCTIENNLIISEGSPTQVGISSPNNAAIVGYNDVENNMKMVNNTVYFDVNHTTGINAGFQISTEGVGHVVANNTVVYEATSGSMACFKITPTATIAAMNNNNCWSNSSSHNWMNNNGTYYSSPANWQLLGGFDSVSSYANPGWTFATPLTIPALDETKTGAQIFATYFTPAGPPLVGTGSAAYAPLTDIANTTRPPTPSIGAYE